MKQQRAQISTLLRIRLLFALGQYVSHVSQD
jgi:hypothetical protein